MQYKLHLPYFMKICNLTLYACGIVEYILQWTFFCPWSEKKTHSCIGTKNHLLCLQWTVPDIPSLVYHNISSLNSTLSFGLKRTVFSVENNLITSTSSWNINSEKFPNFSCQYFCKSKNIRLHMMSCFLCCL